MLPALAGRPLRVELRRSLGPHLAATSIPRRVILLDSEVLRRRGEFERILVHEIFHFTWTRLANATRRDWEIVLHAELDRRARGELGWSAEWRKLKLTRRDPVDRSPAWRRYVCESFCDTAAWLYAGLGEHDEFSLAARFRDVRKRWFERTFPATGPVPI
ncbi:MAG: hypothetical protein LAO79_23775 [Acidobacteriia bacterium]|nr:hypothetical protein [Terriglobia bacterium]